MIVLPLLAMSAYLRWVWPRPAGSTFLAQVRPYLLSLLIGAPFVIAVAPRGRRVLPLLAYLAVGSVLLWIHALAVLCGVRGVCL